MESETSISPLCQIGERHPNYAIRDQAVRETKRIARSRNVDPRSEVDQLWNWKQGDLE
ncbi:hypothetical protein SCLCIDRAFT_1212873 [Scleroderma citrinum Foug A]|uniref:Uncharacterized protein n=1 Tax=Scleroderma citrinum Foug A TaxID=1036808 RepID=A0A0C3AIQ2_9AGAM|nr:hypothetical protein SCLCIDRAFT_1212873 [Scleroderma citrinum Foug A]